MAEQVRELFGGGAAVVAATVNAEGRPSITRGWGATISAQGYVVVCLTARTGSAMRANLAAKGRIAVTAAHPVTYSSAQVKGTVDVVRDPTDDELDRVEAHRARFAGATAEVGLTDAGRAADATVRQRTRGAARRGTAHRAGPPGRAAPAAVLPAAVRTRGPAHVPHVAAPGHPRRHHGPTADRRDRGQ